MGLPLSNAYVKPHIVYASTPLIWTDNSPAHWLCATVVLNPYYNRGEPADSRRYLLVNPPIGFGRTQEEAYNDWAQKTPAY